MTAVMNADDMGADPHVPGTGVAPVKRLRDWVFACLVIILTATLSVGWGVWVTVRTGTYPNGVMTGRTWVSPRTGVELTVLSWQVTRSISDDDRTIVAPDQMVFVTVATRWRTNSPDAYCYFRLVGRGQETFDETQSSRDFQATCDEETKRERGVGVVYRVFLVPQAKLGEIRGVQVDDIMRVDQAPLLRPPPS